MNLFSIMEKKSPRELIISSLKDKSSLKQDVYANTLKAFNQMKIIAEEMVKDLSKETVKFDKRVKLSYKEKGNFEFELRVAGDLLIFSMHTNIFEFDRSHQIWHNSYIREDISRSYCGMINIYNFLNDSFEYNRVNDLGYLVGRMFINKDNHYFLEGKRQLGFLYNDIVNSVISEDATKGVLESAILYSVNFDLFTPPFDSIKEVTVSDMQANSESMQTKTGKRLGFRFQSDNDIID